MADEGTGLRIVAILLALGIDAGGAQAQKRQPPRNKGLCTADEVVVFTCAVRAKTASLCASTDLSPTAGTLVYRFGAPGKIELVHPEGNANPREAFRYSLANRADVVRFTRGDTTFSIYSVLGGRGRRDEDGVLVEKTGGKPVDLRCTKGGLGDFGWSPVYKADLPKTDEPLNR